MASKLLSRPAGIPDIFKLILFEHDRNFPNLLMKGEG